MKYILKLFINGQTVNSKKAIKNLRTICKDCLLEDKYQIEIIDVLKHPEIAEKERIMVTPTLLKQLPPPLKKVLGDLSDKDKVLCGLDLIRSDL